jgi:hypothetical protein
MAWATRSRLARDTEPLDDIERAEGYRALLRAMGTNSGGSTSTASAPNWSRWDFGIDAAERRVRMACTSSSAATWPEGPQVSTRSVMVTSSPRASCSARRTATLIGTR